MNVSRHIIMHGEEGNDECECVYVYKCIGLETKDKKSVEDICPTKQPNNRMLDQRLRMSKLGGVIDPPDKVIRLVRRDKVVVIPARAEVVCNRGAAGSRRRKRVMGDARERRKRWMDVWIGRVRHQSLDWWSEGPQLWLGDGEGRRRAGRVVEALS